MALSHRPKGECVTDHRPKIYYKHACPANSVWQSVGCQCYEPSPPPPHPPKSWSGKSRYIILARYSTDDIRRAYLYCQIVLLSFR